ncbi:copper homeostasis protein CutC [Pseudoflavitalea rhizosphaerae]|uniref:copper homeostasis protein CutC n=1 Tax=Pseudoflavitalea rhizosphaerae TaxID=1884793 RepID=UPI000F8F3CEF|nr:copper homeostasis protein CutC [Pseudoflavitalea rhizosphaerae]
MAILEICAYNIQSALIAEKAGAARVELCASAPEGGITPSPGTLRLTREKLSIQLYPIIRPRGGDFLYDDKELAIMRQDILFCRSIGCEGISTGVQLANGYIDTDRMKRIIEWAYPMQVTCHRVFDSTPDAFRSLEELIACGCERVLTSGHATAAPEGTALLAKLVEQAAGRIIIMPGAGVRAGNIKALRDHTKATEFHTSAKKMAESGVSFHNPSIRDTGDVFVADEEEIRSILKELNS